MARKPRRTQPQVPELLAQLVTTPGVPGREHRVRDLISDHVTELADEITTDKLGSLIVTQKPRPKTQSKTSRRSSNADARPARIMVAAHMDQIGFIVKHIDTNGFLRLTNVGGFDTRNLFARLVRVCPDVRDPDKDLPGVLNPGGKPVHIASPEDRKKVPEIEDLTIDLGLPAKEVHKQVSVGDMVVLDAQPQAIGDTIVSQCLDNRVACYIAIEALRQLKHHDAEISIVFTVQEEVGLRGAGPAAYGLQPDVGIALDTTLCCDTPGVPDTERVTQQGQGIGLNVMDGAAITDLDLYEQIEKLAKKRRIKAQRTLLHKGGTDAGTIQRAGAGIPVMTLLTPTRYIHTVTEMVHQDDLKAAISLLAAYLETA
ncbi:M42 family metallopeptidase [Mucisphaera calidilacus]|uniref:Aminopeptidase YsdC n=1 Tax=Mucisphaera calidilacus TaxID=2527982 RepID=A0A518BTP0_9BACT|nr:M20/M25/M40 family metallo-hydrolase [Mucisphaera calidilacus]QDU70338.1 Putative aminopeptidase YsdC [Mucisphaera calidilacus]